MLTGWTRLGAVGALALGGFLVVDSFGASSGAQTAPPVTIPNAGVDAAPDLSADGNIVVFSSLKSTGVSNIVVHDRIAGTTVAIPGSSGGEHPAVSGDGCTVVWSVAPVGDNQQVDPETEVGSTTTTTTTTTTADLDTVDPTTADPGAGDPAGNAPGAADPAANDPAPSGPASFQAASAPAGLFAIDRCAPDAGVTELVPATGVDEFGPPAVSSDGAVIVASVGSEVVRFDRTTGGYAPTAAFVPPAQDPSDAGPALFVDVDVDLSADGSTVVFAGGPDLTVADGLTVYRVDRVGAVDTVSVVAASAHQPSVSGDGTIVAYTAAVADPAPSTVTIRQNADRPVPLGLGSRPSISGDGNHVVYQSDDALQLSSWIGSESGAFSQIDTSSLGGAAVPVSGAAIDRFANTAAFDSAPADGVETDITIISIAADAGFDADTYRLGTGDLGTTLSTTVTFTNGGPASLGVASIAVDGTFRVAAESCTPVVRPGSTCSIDVEFTVEFLEDAFGVLALTPVSAATDPVPFTTELRAVGQAPPVQTPETTTTTPSGTGGTTGGSTTGFPRTSTTGGSRTTSTTGGSRTTSTTGGTRTTTATTTTVVPGSVAFTPAAFEFAPTIVDAGRRTGLVEIVNTTPNAVTVVGVRLDPADAAGFQIAETDCAAASLPSNGRCSVTIAFAPGATGEQSAQLVASLDGGTEISATLDGVGAEPPTLTVFPGVATTGQVVTIRGDGFPTGLTVELTWSGTTQDVMVDDTGGFAIPVIVLEHTRGGPAEASVAGQTDQFGDVTAEMLVTATSSRSQPGVLDGVGPNVSR
jgi:hypothetical protein